MTRSRADRLFTIPAGVPFLGVLARALIDGRLVPGFAADPADPLALSRATIYVPTRRAARALRSEFVDLSGGGSAILPTIRPLGEVDDDAGYFDSALPDSLDLPPPIGGIERLVELANLILAWKETLPKAFAAIHGDQPITAPASPADAVWLARALADLIDAMETEGVGFEALGTLEADDHAAWWQLTLEFLKIAGEFLPSRLRELSRSSPAAHRDAALRAEARRLAATPPDGPVIVAGSTGSVPATAELIAAVIGLEQGAVVLPGLDTGMADAHWSEITKAASEGFDASDAAIAGHPQFGLARLIGHLGLIRDNATALADEADVLKARAALVSAALLPARATADWATPGFLPDTDAIDAATDAITLVEAANEREEAQAIALAMRLALDDGADHDNSRQVALVTPDRTLARRVAAELARFGIEADDSGGVPLTSTHPATLITLIVEAAHRPGDPVALAALMKHPLARFGRDAQQARRAAEVIEMIALRGGTGEADAANISEFLERRLTETKQDRHAPVWRKRLAPMDLALAEEQAGQIEAALKPLVDLFVRFAGDRPQGGLTHRFPVAQIARATIDAAEATARDAEGNLAQLWSGEAGEKLVAILSELVDGASAMTVFGAEWAAMLPALFGGELVKPSHGGHDRVHIWGALEARLQAVDVIVLAGLNEGTWPSVSENDPFLSRAMKAIIGLDPPERRIGQAAHDFQMGLGTRHVILSRAGRSGSEPTVASRWLQRFLAVAGPGAQDAMRSRGTDLISRGINLDRAEPVAFAPRPAPTPPADSQPKRYSFSEVKTLRRDPYAIYARRILRLDPVEDFLADPGAAERGTLYHAILEDFARAGTDPGDPDAAQQLADITATRFREEKLPPHVEAIWRPRFDQIAELFLVWERARNDQVRRRLVEARADFPLAGSDYSIGGRADRIDILDDGTAAIIDFKTGTQPSAKQARTLLDPQLPLEAAALAGGGFAAIGATTPSQLLYVRLRPDDPLKVDRVDIPVPRGKQDAISATELGVAALEQFAGFVSALASGSHGFVSQLVPASARDYGGEYDHLARVAEWSTAEEAGGDDE